MQSSNCSAAVNGLCFRRNSRAAFLRRGIDSPVRLADGGVWQACFLGKPPYRVLGVHLRPRILKSPAHQHVYFARFPIGPRRFSFTWHRRTRRRPGFPGRDSIASAPSRGPPEPPFPPGRPGSASLAESVRRDDAFLGDEGLRLAHSVERLHRREQHELPGAIRDGPLLRQTLVGRLCPLRRCFKLRVWFVHSNFSNQKIPSRNYVPNVRSWIWLLCLFDVPNGVSRR